VERVVGLTILPERFAGIEFYSKTIGSARLFPDVARPSPRRAPQSCDLITENRSKPLGGVAAKDGKTLAEERVFREGLWVRGDEWS